MKAAIYLRVSTGEQTTDNQRRELEAVAEKRGWTIVGVYEDAGISGAKGRRQRPGLDSMLRHATQGKIDVVMAWSVDRLGRSLQDLVQLLTELQSSFVELYLHKQALDTSTPSGRAMFGMLGVFAEFERALIQERVKAGMARARAEGKRIGNEPKVTDSDREEILDLDASGYSLRQIAERVGLGKSTVQRVLKESKNGNSAANVYAGAD